MNIDGKLRPYYLAKILFERTDKAGFDEAGELMDRNRNAL